MQRTKVKDSSDMEGDDIEGDDIEGDDIEGADIEAADIEGDNAYTYLGSVNLMNMSNVEFERPGVYPPPQDSVQHNSQQAIKVETSTQM